MRFDCSKYPELGLGSFELTVLTGVDEGAAVERAGGSRTRLQEQLVADAICKVNDEDVTRPFVRWADWDQRTRAVVRAAFQRLHSATADEMAAFLATESGGIYDATGLGLAFKAIQIGVCTGREENAALDQLGENLTNYQITETLIGLSIAAVDGQPTEQSFDWSAWDLRTREFVREAHDRTTAISEAMINDIVGGAGDAPLPEAGHTTPG